MGARAKPLEVGTPVRIRRDDVRHNRWTGKIDRVSCCDRLYHVDLSHDCDGERLAAKHVAGPFILAELETLEGARGRR